MFEHLDNPRPVAFGDPAFLEGARRRADRLRFRRRMLGAGTTTVAVFLAGILAVGALDADPASEVKTVSEPEPTTTTSTSASPTTTAAPAVAPTSTTAAPSTTSTTIPRMEPTVTRMGKPAVPARPGVRLSVRLQRRTVAAGDAMFGEFVIENGSQEELRYHPHCGGVYEYGLYRLGKPVGGGGGEKGVGCTADAKPPVVVPAGQSHRVKLTLHAIADAGHPDGYLLAPGTYQASAAMPSPDGDGYWFAPAVDVTIPNVRPLPAASDSGGPTFKPPPGIRMVLEVSRRNVAVGENLPAVLIVENGSSEPFRFRGMCRTAGWGFYRDGRWMGGRSENVTGEVPPGCESPPITTLAPGERFTREFSFETTGHYNYSTQKQEQIKPGRYEAAAGVQHAAGEQEFTDLFWFAAPVEIDVR